MKSSCGCREARAHGALEIPGRGRMGPRAAEQPRRLTERPRRPRESEPIVLSDGRGAKCRPFIKIEKDADKFAACNALADKLGPINTPKKAFSLISDAIGDELNEVFGIMTLDIHLRMKGLAETGRGEPSSVMAPLQPTLQAAIADGAHAVIIFHVHPSGIEAEPSDADMETTEAFADACETIGLPLLDHVIVGGDKKRRSYYSFAESKTI